jgi:hypothetical protein
MPSFGYVLLPAVRRRRRAPCPTALSDGSHSVERWQRWRRRRGRGERASGRRKWYGGGRGGRSARCVLEGVRHSSAASSSSAPALPFAGSIEGEGKRRRRCCSSRRKCACLLQRTIHFQTTFLPFNIRKLYHLKCCQQSTAVKSTILSKLTYHYYFFS